MNIDESTRILSEKTIHINESVYNAWKTLKMVENPLKSQ